MQIVGNIERTKINKAKITNVLLPVNALVICNTPHPPAPGNSGNFDFWYSKSLLNAPLCRETTAVFPPQSAIFSFHGLFCLHKANPGYFPRTALAKLWSKLCSFPRLSPTLPQGWGPLTHTHQYTQKLQSKGLITYFQNFKLFNIFFQYFSEVQVMFEPAQFNAAVGSIASSRCHLVPNTEAAADYQWFDKRGNPITSRNSKWVCWKYRREADKKI